MPAHLIAWIRRALHHEAAVPPEAFEIVRSTAHGAAQAVLTAMDRLGVARLLSARRCPEADLIRALIAARVIEWH